MEISAYALSANPQPSPKHKTTTCCVRGAHYAGDRPTREQLDQLYNVQELSEGKIAHQYGVTKKTVSNWLKMAGIDRRTASESGKLRYATQAEHVPVAEREDCLLDRAWEARPERRIRDKVACRRCFRLVSRLTGRTGHLAVHHDHMTGAEYGVLMPGHPRDCFLHSAGSNELDIEKLMDDWCAKWATADEIRKWRLDPGIARSQEYVGCLECGRKIFADAAIQVHVKGIHKWSLPQYHERYPGAPTGSLKRRAMQADQSKKRWYELKRLRAEAKAAKAPKPKRMTRETKVRITARAYFRILGKSQWDMAKDGDLYPRQRLVDHAYKSIYGFDQDYEKHIDSEVARLRQLDPAEQRAEGMAARAKLRT